MICPPLTGIEHDLKTWPVFFQDVATGRKPFEVRQNDRRFAVGDMLLLREWDPHRSSYTGRYTKRVVSYIFRDAGLLHVDYVVLGLVCRSEHAHAEARKDHTVVKIIIAAVGVAVAIGLGVLR